MKHILKILVNNHPGVMSHVSGLFSRRSFNIDSIAVGVTDNPEISVMIIVVKGNEHTLAQVKKQLLKLTDVIEVEDLAYQESFSRELVLFTITSNDTTRLEILSICEVFEAKIVDMTKESLVIEYCGSPRQVTAIIEMMKKFGILEIVRTGQIAMKYRS